MLGLQVGEIIIYYYAVYAESALLMIYYSSVEQLIHCNIAAIIMLVFDTTLYNQTLL